MQQLVFKVLFKLIPSLSSYSLKKAMNKMRFIVPDILVGKPLLLELPGYRQLLTRELRHPYSRAGQLEKKAIFTQRGTTTLQKKKTVPSPGFLGKCYFSSRQPQEHFIIKSQRCKIYIGKKCFARAM